ncbi:TraI domain-containing protein [Legionella taurinensis]|nr:TraI domain-containing protein [Legionella taurinensis]STY27420.1 putative helicase/relaxase [Legionella taurinensis]
MFHRPGKKGKALQARPLKDMTRVLAAEVLLAEEKRVTLLNQIKDTLALDSTRFETLCQALMNHFVNHCQNLPETSNSYYSQPGGFLDHALNRTEAALNLFKQFILLDGAAELSEEQKLWQYTLFSAALLQGIGKLQIDLKVELFDNNGLFLKQWNPLLESLAAVGSHYVYEFLKESDVEFRRRLNLLLATRLMPATGFAWIASNPQVLAIWLALLNEDHYAAGTLGAILIRADAIAIQRYFNQLMARNYGSRGGNRYGRVSTFAGGVPESISNMEQQLGLEFIQWLTKSLESGRIMINKAPLLMVPGGLLMSPDIFKLFVREHPEFKNWQAIQNGFLSLGLHRAGPDGQVVSRFEQLNNQQMHSGIVFADYAIALPAEVSVHSLQSGKVSTLSATEFIHQAQVNHQFIGHASHAAIQALHHLNAEGRWQTVAPASAQAKPGVLNGA